MGSYSDYEYVLKGDTLIEDRTYKKAELSSGEIIGYVREDTLCQKIYNWDIDNQTEALLIDYSLEAGDIFYRNNSPLVCKSVSYDFLYGRLRKVIHFNSVERFTEGIGYSFYGVADWNGGYQYITNFEELSEQCLTATHGVLEQKMEVSVYPNPFANKLNVLSNRTISGTIYILNNSGQIVRIIISQEGRTQEINLEYLPQGIYYLLLEKQGVIKITKQ